MRAEGVLKFEYVVLKERQKNQIVKEYLESELKVLQHEKQDIQLERERYARLSEHER